MGARARWLAFAGLGHNVRHYSVCAEGIVAAFIAQPDRDLDAEDTGNAEIMAALGKLARRRTAGRAAYLKSVGRQN